MDDKNSKDEIIRRLSLERGLLLDVCKFVSGWLDMYLMGEADQIDLYSAEIIRTTLSLVFSTIENNAAEEQVTKI